MDIIYFYPSSWSHCLQQYLWAYLVYPCFVVRLMNTHFSLILSVANYMSLPPLYPMVYLLMEMICNVYKFSVVSLKFSTMMCPANSNLASRLMLCTDCVSQDDDINTDNWMDSSDVVFTCDDLSDLRGVTSWLRPNDVTSRFFWLASSVIVLL